MDTFLPELNDFIQSGTGLTDSWIMDDKFGARGGVIKHGWKPWTIRISDFPIKIIQN